MKSLMIVSSSISWLRIVRDVIQRLLTSLWIVFVFTAMHFSEMNSWNSYWEKLMSVLSFKLLSINAYISLDKNYSTYR